MILTKETFISTFIEWIDRKLKEELQEEDMEMNMLNSALDIIIKHKHEIFEAIEEMKNNESNRPSKDKR